MNRLVSRAGIAAVAAVVLAITGCSTSVELSQKQLEDGSSTQLALDPEHKPEVRCDGGLKGEVGATQKCKVDVGGGRWVDYTATVTKVDGKTVNWDIKADHPEQVSG
ncbi:DUF4333 domain-containing protein [Gordonia sp. (in: high G+C Gram-positive bacteria)]|uniref:DUF4333 domain-containing protein n=1 Tax=unclassified Gordonia (in: high G+C Gram-positive bacteria) TaxID=2657482 RepID=UPI003528C060